MTKHTIKTGSEDDFYKRGHQLARAADRGERLPVAEKVLPGHGCMKEVRATAQRFGLQAEVA